jgi:uncharacterized protein YqjF (DUF2071 family)
MDDKGLKKRNWIIAQRWSHVLFLSVRCDPDLIRQKIPAELDVDTYDGSAWLSIVPFHMSHIRFPFTPALPMGSLWELNLRTYVKHNERPGIYFFTLDTDNWLGQKIAKYCFNLPYRFREMSGQIGEGRYSFESPDSFRMEAEPGSMIESNALDAWLVERYHLFTKKTNCLYRGDVMHDPWKLRELDALSYEDTFSSQFGFEPATEVHARYAESLDVKFRPFAKMSLAR